MQAILIILVLLAVFLVIFTLQNSAEISIHILFWEISNVPLVLVILSCIFLGWFISAIYFYPRIWKLRRENKNLLKENQELEEYKFAEDDDGEDLEDEHPEGIKLDDDDYSNSFFKD